MPSSTETDYSSQSEADIEGPNGKDANGATPLLSEPFTSNEQPADDVASPSGPTPDRSVGSTNVFAKPRRWDLYILFNIAIPILLIATGGMIIKLLGTAEAKPVPPPDSSEIAVLESLPAARIERIQSLAETGRRLELQIDGNVVPFQEAQVSSEVAGRVVFKSEVCEAGAIVSEGEILMKIDPTDYELEVERLRRLRDQEYRALGEVDQEMINTKRSIDIAREDVRLKQKEVDRQASLKRFASQSEIDQAKSALVQASQSLVNLENQLDLQRAKRTRLEASEQLAATQLRVADVNLERCVVRAPISGVVVSEEADLNTFVNRGTRLITIEDISKVEVAASMRMDQLYWVLDQTASSANAQSVVQNVNYDLPDTPAIIEYEVSGRENAVHRWQGTLVSFDGIGIDPSTRTVPVRILVDDPRHFVDENGKLQNADRTTALLRGMFVRARLLLKPTTDLIVVPARALRPGNRVWKFSEDEEVLREAVAKAEKRAEEWAETQSQNLAESSQNAASAEVANAKDETDAAETSQDSEPKFDPSGWSTGRVTYSKTIYPVDALRLSGDEKSDDETSKLAQGQRKLWVCEASKSDLGAGDYVVVSPLDAIPPAGLPVRGKVEE